MGIPEYSLLIFNLYNYVISLRLRSVADAEEIAGLSANLKLFYSRALCSGAAVAWKATLIEGKAKRLREEIRWNDCLSKNQLAVGVLC